MRSGAATTAQGSFPLETGTVTVAVTTANRLAAARACVARVAEAVDRACGAHRDDSDLSRVNSGAGRAVRVGTTFLEVLQTALHGAEMTGGLVDPTAPGARVRWPGQPAPWRSIEVDAGAQTVRLPEGTALDLGAVTRAFAADLAALMVVEETGCGVLVAVDRAVAVAGPAPPGGWPVRVPYEHRCAVRGAPVRAPGQDIVLPGPGGLATAGLTGGTRRQQVPGRCGHGIVDPRTAEPVRGPWRTVSVSAATCVDAGIAALAALVHGPGAARRLEEHRLPARLVHIDGWVTTVAGWPADRLAAPGLKVAG